MGRDAGSSGSATITATTRSRLGVDYQKKSFAFSVVEFSQLLLRRGYEAVIAGVTCQIAYFLEIPPRFVYSPQFTLHFAPVIVGFGKIRFQSDCLVKIGDGVFAMAYVVLRSPPVEIGFGKIRFQLDGLVVIGDGSFVVASEAV